MNDLDVLKRVRSFLANHPGSDDSAQVLASFTRRSAKSDVTECLTFGDLVALLELATSQETKPFVPSRRCAAHVGDGTPSDPLRYCELSRGHTGRCR